MLDVHAPEHGINGVRDFFLHLVTITIGLFIALLLEAGVEALHHRHQRNEADATIRRELKENRADLVKAQATLHDEMKNMLTALDFLEARSKGVSGDAAGLKLRFSMEPLQDAAWRTAASTGVLTYMNYTQVEKYSVAYKVQDQFETMEQQAISGYLKLDSFIVRGSDTKSMTPEEAQQVLPEVRNALALLGGMLDVSRGAIEADDDALKK